MMVTDPQTYFKQSIRVLSISVTSYFRYVATLRRLKEIAIHVQGWLTLNGLHRFTSQKMILFITTAVKTLNPKYIFSVSITVRCETKYSFKTLRKKKLER
jgi:hypothetical protein